MPEFHIHIDASALEPELEQFALQDLGFWKSDFLPPRMGAESFQPARHLTLKPSRGQDFRRAFNDLLSAVSSLGGLEGFIEGEAVGHRRRLETKPFNERVPSPFTLRRRFLAPGQFRESELHIRMRQEGTDPRLMRRLERIGFFSARAERVDGEAVLFTAQGCRKDVGIVIAKIEEYLNQAGGALDCTLKEERIIRYWLSSPNVPMPPVIDRIEFR